MTIANHSTMRFAPACRSGGFSLVELMIAMAITLALTAVASYAYLGSKQTYRVGDEQNQLYEEARFTLNFLGQNIKSAGYSPAVEPAGSDSLSQFSDEMMARQAINGCDNGFNATSRTCSAGASTNDALYLAYFTDDPSLRNNAAFGIGVDCAGNNAVATTAANNNTMYMVENWFYLDSSTYLLDGITRTLPQLSCRGNGGATPVALFKGVEDMQILYGVGLANTDQVVDRMMTAGEVQTANAWDKVLSVQICVLMQTLGSGVTTGTSTYVDCSGATKNQVAGIIRRSFTSTYNLRNRVTK